MITYLLNKYKTSKSLVNYFLLTYLDKIISFALPLSILFLMKDKALYTFVEVAFSYATLLMIVIELGFSNYLFYGYKQASDKELFVLNAQVFFKTLLVLYCLLLIPVAVLIKHFDPLSIGLFALMSVRALFMFYVSFYSNIYRLMDQPSKIYWITIIVNLLSILLLVPAKYFAWPHKIVYFFIPTALLIVGMVFRYFVVEFRLLNIAQFFKFMKDALRFSWPIILNVLAMGYINSYAKIYAYDHLSQEETLEISYIMRIGLIIQLSHASFSSFFSKSLFMDEQTRLNRSIFKKYNLVLLGASFLVMCIMFLTNLFFSKLVLIPLNLSTLFFVLYILLWCYLGYLEIYFGILNANRNILVYSIISSVVYTILLQICGTISVFKLSIIMVVTAVLNLCLVFYGLHKLKVVTFKKN